MSPEKYLIDTTIWVGYLRGLDASLKDRLGPLVLEGRACTSDVIIMEILRGAKSDREYSMLYEDFLALPRLETDERVWETAWKAAYKLRKGGVNVPLTDVLIASIAVRHGCALMHSDKHFRVISGRMGLKTVEA